MRAARCTRCKTASLLQYDERTDDAAVPEERTAKKLVVSADAAKEGQPVCRSWRRLMNIGYARNGLIGTVQEQIKRARQEIGFTDLRFHGIFDDDMHIYQQNEDGSP